MHPLLRRIPIAYLAVTGWQYAGNYRSFMLLYFVLFVGAQLVALAEPVLLGKLINSVQIEITTPASVEHLLKEVALCLGLLFLIELLFWLMHGPGRVLERITAFNTRANFKTHMYRLVSSLPLRWHRQHHSGESIDKINRATNSLGQFLDDTFELNYMIFRLVGSQIVLFCFLPFAGWVALGTTLLAFFVVYVFDRYLFDQYGVLNKNENHVASAVHDYVTNIETVITLRLEKRTLKEVLQRIFKKYVLFKHNVRAHEVKWFLTTMLIAVMTVSVLWYYVYSEVKSGRAVMGGTFFALWEYLRRIGQSFYDFTGLYGTLVRQSADVKGAESIQQAADELSFSERPPALPSAWQSIQVEGVYFRYEDDEHKTHHLDGAFITIEKGKSIALVGESGSGKSTMLRLLRGLHQPDAVQVFLDGLLLEDGLSSLAPVTTLLPQDPQVFAETIRANVSFGLEADDDEILEAIEMSRFTPVLERLPRGLDTDIAEKGVNLSGGEKQRLALARGIFFARDCQIILLDEPTSSVDTLNERLIYERLLDKFRSKCLISSIHKLHLLDLFDEIYVFDNGRIAEHGSFENLLAAGGKLAGLWDAYQRSTGEMTIALLPDAQISTAVE